MSFPQSQIYQILDLKVPIFNMVTWYFMCYLYVIENYFTVTPAGIQMPAILWPTSHIDFSLVRFTAALLVANDIRRGQFSRNSFILFIQTV